jgi:hypothetical protein
VAQPIPAVLGFDCWTSTSNTAILAAIATFIDEEWNLRIAFLGIHELGESHGAVSMSTGLKEIMNKFPGLEFWATVSDTTAVNPATAACPQLDYNKCQVHVLQRSIVTQVYRELAKPLDHLETMISYFKGSPRASKVLSKHVLDLRAAGKIGGTSTKLVKMNKTRWTSTWAAVERFNQLVDAVAPALLDLDKAQLVPRKEHIQDLKEVEQLLKPLAEITEHLEARK